MSAKEFDLPISLLLIYPLNKWFHFQPSDKLFKYLFCPEKAAWHLSYEGDCMTGTTNLLDLDETETVAEYVEYLQSSLPFSIFQGKKQLKKVKKLQNEI